MERKIKFRGKLRNSQPLLSLKRHEWIYGGISFAYNEAYIHSEKHLPKDFGVIHETVGQFTGLNDKYGRDIYDGDIVKTDTGKVCEIKWGKVTESVFNQKDKITDVFQYHGFGMCFQGRMYHLDFPDELEIIGNIHDNPELLKWK